MEKVKLYLFEEDREIKLITVANDINVAMTVLQAKLDLETEFEDFFQSAHLLTQPLKGYYLVDIYENYKEGREQLVLTKDMVSHSYDVYEFPFVMGQIYGRI